MARNNKAANKRRATQTWDKDPTRPGAPSALEVLMTWLTAPGNAERWRRENRKELSNEIIQKLHTHGIYDREPSDVQYKIRIMEHNFSSATALLSHNKQVDAFQRGEADHKIVAQVMKLCPQYRQLLQVFGKNAKNPQVTTNGAVNGATRDLERKAFIERAKQERDQRETLFNLERAKLECELQAKQVQLAMERSLARKKLLGAGIDPAEVDRVLPL
eukprot:jgi/Phyca11/566803/estExt2_Genewise1.C_PHYCAscaffold_220483